MTESKCDDDTELLSRPSESHIWPGSQPCHRMRANSFVGWAFYHTQLLFATTLKVQAGCVQAAIGRETASQAISSKPVFNTNYITEAKHIICRTGAASNPPYGCFHGVKQTNKLQTKVSRKGLLIVAALS